MINKQSKQKMRHNNSNELRWKPLKQNESRLQFPINGDSGLFNNVGRRHYDQLSNRSDKNIFNPEMPAHSSEKPYYLRRKQSKHLEQQLYSPNPILRRQYKDYGSGHSYLEDSLVREEKDFDLKKQDKPKGMTKNDSYNSVANSPKNVDGYLKIYGTIESAYDILHDPRRNKSLQLHQPSNTFGRGSRKSSLPYHTPPQAKMPNPTYISSSFEAV